MFAALLACADSGDASGDRSPSTTASALIGTVVALPGGSFPMGCDPAVDSTCDGDEQPVHTVTLSPYAIGATEVTVMEWDACIAAGACGPPVGEPRTQFVPVTGITKEAAEGYCAWKGGRLPTEAEWEFAARGEDARIYPWGAAAPDCDLAASRVCDGSLTPVAAHLAGASPFGVQDLAGNAWEWVSDTYDAGYYATSPATDPTGAEPGGLCVVRGVDSWSDDHALRATNRTMVIPDAQSPVVGFRCVASG